MKYINLSCISLVVIVAVCGCSNDDEICSTSAEYVHSVRVTVEDFQLESSDTRTAYTVDGSGFQFQWVEGDALGIYPVGGDQVKFPISNGDGSVSANFDGGAWKLRSEYQYAAYYPFSADNYKIDQKALPVSFTGQTQKGNGSTAHLGAYDYLACAATSPNANGGVDLSMKHLGAFLRLQLTMPKADAFSSVTLESDGTKFVTSGTFDLAVESPAVTPSGIASTLTINLIDVSTTQSNKVLTIYAILAPADLSSNHITIHVRGNDGTMYRCKTQGKNFEARKAYSIEANEFAINDHEYVDLGLPSGRKWATCNVGASSPEEAGNLYAWGETTPKSEYTWSNYKWGVRLTKYVTSSGYGTVDNLTVLQAQDDAAYINWGEDWRTPSMDDYVALTLYCSWTWTSLNGVEGFRIVSRKNGNSIFLPANFGDWGDYWTRDLAYDYDTDEWDDRYPRDRDAFDLQFTGSKVRVPDPKSNWVTYEERCKGFGVRPVLNPL